MGKTERLRAAAAEAIAVLKLGGPSMSAGELYELSVHARIILATAIVLTDTPPRPRKPKKKH